MARPIKWNTVQRKVNDLIPYEKNPRILTEAKKANLIASLEKFGLAEIPAINKDNTLLAGHQRMKVMQLLGKGEEIIDVRRPNRQLNQKEVKEYNITSNISAGEWDVQLLESDFADIELGELGLDLAELDIKPSRLTDEELNEVPDPPKIPFSTPGDLYELNGHRVLCGDSTNIRDIEKLMGGHLADMVFQDPPYNVKIDNVVNNTGRSKSKKKRHSNFLMAAGEMSKHEFSTFLTICFENNKQSSKDGSIHFNFMDWKHIDEIHSSLISVFGALKQLIVWNKDVAGMGTFYRSKHELIFITKHGDQRHTNNFQLGQTGRYRTNVWDYPSATSFRNKTRIGNNGVGVGDLEFHPTVKPIRLVIDAIIDCSKRGEIIQDLFLGSGTTLIASEETKRSCYGMELDPMYCDVIIKRWVSYNARCDKKITIKRNGAVLTTSEIKRLTDG